MVHAPIYGNTGGQSAVCGDHRHAPHSQTGLIYTHDVSKYMVTDMENCHVVMYNEVLKILKDCANLVFFLYASPSTSAKCYWDERTQPKMLQDSLLVMWYVYSIADQPTLKAIPYSPVPVLPRGSLGWHTWWGHSSVHFQLSCLWNSRLVISPLHILYTKFSICCCRRYYYNTNW